MCCGTCFSHLLSSPHRLTLLPVLFGTPSNKDEFNGRQERVWVGEVQGPSVRSGCTLLFGIVAVPPSSKGLPVLRYWRDLSYCDSTLQKANKRRGGRVNRAAVFAYIVKCVPSPTYKKKKMNEARSGALFASGAWSVFRSDSGRQILTS